MSIILDVLIVAVFIIALISGWKRGFVRSFMRIISVIGAVIVTKLLYPSVSALLYDKIVFGKVSDYIRSIFERDIGSTGKSLSDLFGELPEFFTKFLDRFSTQSDAQRFFKDNPNATAGDLSDFLAKPIANTISNVIAIVLLFFVSYIAFKLLTLLLDRVVKLPLLSALNHGLGIALGAILGLAIIWVLSIIIHALIPQLISLYPNAFKETTFDNTLIVRNLYNFNLFTVIDLFKF